MVKLRRSLLVLLLFVIVASAAPTGGEDLVILNKVSKKYHCVTCRWARECTANCVKVSRDDAIRTGAEACKVCKGRCG